MFKIKAGGVPYSTRTGVDFVLRALTDAPKDANNRLCELCEDERADEAYRGTKEQKNVKTMSSYKSMSKPCARGVCVRVYTSAYR